MPLLPLLEPGTVLEEPEPVLPGEVVVLLPEPDVP